MVVLSFDVRYGFDGKDALKNGNGFFLSSEPSSVNLQNQQPTQFSVTSRSPSEPGAGGCGLFGAPTTL